MKVILQKDVKGTGKAGDVCEVNDGYARNFLIPRKLALPGDASSINAAYIKKQADAHRLEMQRKRAKELAAGMNGLNVKVYAKCGEYLGRGLSILVDTLNPQVIVIGSIFTHCADLIWPHAKAVMDRECLAAANRVCRVVPAELGGQEQGR